MYSMKESIVLSALQQCTSICESTISILLQMPDVYMQRHQIQVLRDCADICSLTAEFVARKSYYARFIAAICADICFACADYCFKYYDDASQLCGQTCLYCAKVCRKYNFRAITIPTIDIPDIPPLEL